MYHRWRDVFLWTSTLSSLFTSAYSALNNRTIDDTLGDRVTQFVPIYEPATVGVWEDASCVSCFIQPSKDLAFDGTWTAATFRPVDFSSMSIELQFTGVAIYVFFILANNLGPGISTRTVCKFLLDGALDTDFIHDPTSSSDLEYNALAYQKQGLSNTTHTVTILTDTTDPNINITAGEQIFVNFDYAIYTFDDGVEAPTETSQAGADTATHSPSLAPIPGSKGTPVAAIVGGIVGALVLISAAGFALYFFRKRRQGKDASESLETPLSPYSDHTRPLPFDAHQLYPRTGTDGQVSQTGIPPFGQSGVMAVSSRPSIETFGTSGRPGLPSTGFGNTSTSGASVHYAPVPGDSHNFDYGPAFGTMTSGTSHQPSLTEGTSPPSTLSADQTRPAGTQSHMVVTNGPDNGVTLRESRQLELGRKMAAVQRELSGTVAEVRQGDSNLEMADLRSQVNQLREQLSTLQNQTQSPWALGLSDDPPPGYTPALS